MRIAKKEISDLAREKTILVAIVVQLFIAGFSTFLLFGLQGVTDPDHAGNQEMNVGYEGTGGFLHVLREHGINAFQGNYQSQFQRGDFQALIEESIVADQHVIDIVLAEGDPVSSLRLNQLKGALQDYEQTLRHERELRLNTTLVELPQKESVPYGFAYGTLLPLMCLVPVFLAGSMTGDTVQQEIQEKTLLLLRAAPMPLWHVWAGKLLVTVTLAPLQALLWIGLFAANGWPVDNLLLLIPFLLVLALLLSCLGALLGLFVQGEGQAQSAYALLVITLGALSTKLNPDPLNAIARIATNRMGSDVHVTVMIIAAAAGLALLGLIVALGSAGVKDRL